MKVSIIGGGGRVGATAAYALQLGGMVREMALVDVNLDMAAGEALDLRHGASLVAPQNIYAGGPEAVEGSDIVLITAGLRRKPEESRLDLINRNVAVFRGILDSIKNVKLTDDAVIVVVSNPVDILTYLTVESKIVPTERVIGLGTYLDTTRFRGLLAEYLDVSAKDVDALILGEHGDSMVPIWSTATVNSVPLASFPNYDKAKIEAVFEDTKKSGAEVIRLKGGAGYAVGVTIRELVHAIILDKRALLPVSTLQHGALGIEGVCISLPTVVGRAGAMNVIEIKASDSEVNALRASAEVLRETLSQIA
jgi:L-lactate dehydrogenase